MKKANTLLIYALLIAIIAYLVYRDTKKDKVVYVDNIELFSGFKMKAELETKYKEVERIRKSILDSMYTELKLKSDLHDLNAETLNAMKQAFLMKKELFNKENSETMAQYNDQIWNQLNEYTRQYGEQEHYDFIFGANGQGVIMYAKDTKNVTKELLQFANQKFSGK